MRSIIKTRNDNEQTVGLKSSCRGQGKHRWTERFIHTTCRHLITLPVVRTSSIHIATTLFSSSYISRRSAPFSTFAASGTHVYLCAIALNMRWENARQPTPTQTRFSSPRPIHALFYPACFTSSTGSRPRGLDCVLWNQVIPPDRPGKEFAATKVKSGDSI